MISGRWMDKWAGKSSGFGYSTAGDRAACVLLLANGRDGLQHLVRLVVAELLDEERVTFGVGIACRRFGGTEAC